MSRFFSSDYDKLIPYTPGEQPVDRKYIKLNTNESPFPPSPMALRLAREAAGDCMLYSDPQCGVLTEAVASYYGLGKDNVICVNGSDEILNFAFMTFCDKNTPAVFPDITYGFYTVFADLNGIKAIEIPLKDDFTIDINDYLGKNATIFIANPNAPTGIALKRDEIEKIVASNPDNIVVVDEAYIDFGGESAVSLINKYDNLLVTQTFSKSRSLAGARLGIGLGNSEIIRDINTIRYSTNPYNVNRMTMYMGVGAINDKEYFEKCCSEIIKEREKLKIALKARNFTMTDSLTNFLFAKHESTGGKELYLKLKEKGILVRHFEKDRLKDYNRITVGSSEQNEALLKAIDEITGENV